MSDGETMTDDIQITADGLNISATETVSTGDYETARETVTLECSVSGVDVSDGMPESLRERIYALQLELQSQVRSAGEYRKRG